LREMSEELSELDDDELNGLADSDDLVPADGTVSDEHVATQLQKNPKQKRRWRGYR
jgi:NuA3 HAT complex component NTO1